MLKHLSFSFLVLAIPLTARAAAPIVDSAAPIFQAKTHDGKDFDLAARKGHWTVLYFYPKADTPGCTKQACAFRDSIKVLRDQGAEVFGISSDDQKALAKFHEKHHLNFTLLADPKLDAVQKYGTKMPLLKLSKRHTFVIDPELKIRYIDANVDPVKDAEKMAKKIAELQKGMD